VSTVFWHEWWNYTGQYDGRGLMEDLIIENAYYGIHNCWVLNLFFIFYFYFFDFLQVSEQETKVAVRMEIVLVQSGWSIDVSFEILKLLDSL
jgi:hypothetical protein